MKNDIQFALRQLLKHPSFSIVALLTLALGIGANTAVFSVIHAVMLKPLPYPSPWQLVTLWEASPERGVAQERVSGPNFLDWQREGTLFESMALSPGWEGSTAFNLALGDSTVKIKGSYVSASFFTTLGVQPLLGRALRPEEDQREGYRAAVISHGLWLRHFGADPNILGRPLTVDSYGKRVYEIVGVMPAGFGLPSETELWLPIGWMGVSLDARRSAHWHNVIARLKPGVTIEQARAQLTAIQARLKAAYPNEQIGSRVEIVPLLEQALGRNLQRGLMALWAVVAGVLLIACVNVANLMLARASARAKEIALRVALGATRARIARQLLVESVLLALVAGALGAMMGWWAMRLIVVFGPANIPRLADATLSGTALAFTFGLSLLAGILFGLAPAWRCSFFAVNSALKDASPHASGGPAAAQLRNGLVIAEVALSLLLLVWAGLMLQSFWRMRTAERGFQSEQLLTAELDFSVSGFTTWVQPTATRPQVPLRELIERLKTYPGVEAVGAGSMLLKRDNAPPNQPISIYGRPAGKTDAPLTAAFKGITPDWIRAMGARVTRGRGLADSDHLTAPGVALVNQTFVRRYFPNQDPLGKFICLDDGIQPLDAKDRFGISVWSEIVGVVSDIKSLHPQPEAVPEIYRSYWQWPMQSPALVVRVRGGREAASIGAAILQEAKSLLPNSPPPVIRKMDDVLADSVAQPRFQAGLIALFGLIALLLAATGLYGVLAYLVTQRTQEIGIRKALGAQTGNILGLILKQGMTLSLAGTALGLAAALAIMRLLRSLLYEVSPTDPWTLLAVSALLLAIAFLASWFPARRAAEVDPLSALRYE